MPIHSADAVSGIGCITPIAPTRLRLLWLSVDAYASPETMDKVAYAPLR